MIPKQMNEFLQDALPEQSWKNRLQYDGSLAYMEFGPLDVDRLQRMGIEVDNLGPHLVVCMWDAESALEIGGFLVVDNLAMGRPSMGGIRMMPDITPAIIHNLARGMTLKNAAADLPFGGGKSGIVASADLSPEAHREVVRGFARLLHRYGKIYLPGPDVGTNDHDMKTIAIENGLNRALSKTVDMGGNRIDQLGGAGQGVVVAIETLLEEIHRLKSLPQCANLHVPAREDLTILIQGFGAVGTHVARLLAEEDPQHAPRIIGISDASGYIYNECGLPVPELLETQERHDVAAYPYYEANLTGLRQSPTKFSNFSDDLLRESAYCLVPAAPIANYLDVDSASNPCMTVDRMGDWVLIVEGANTYSPSPDRRAARCRMERTVYWQKGVIIATDFLVNSGGVIFAAQEQLIKVPDHLLIPQEMLGDRVAVDRWLMKHKEEFATLAEQRRLAGRAKLVEVIRRNMKELIDLLVADPDMLPCEAAEQIAINRIATSESGRTVADVMVAIPAIQESQTVREAAELLIIAKGDLLAVISEQGALVGVVTDRDITEASAATYSSDTAVTQIMTCEVVSACPGDRILDVVRKLEYHEISAVPIVDDGSVVGVVSSDILAQRTLYRLLQAME
jgi:glutamate dehydrogenase (NAD(P)+)